MACTATQLLIRVVMRDRRSMVNYASWKKCLRTVLAPELTYYRYARFLGFIYKAISNLFQALGRWGEKRASGGNY